PRGQPRGRAVRERRGPGPRGRSGGGPAGRRGGPGRGAPGPTRGGGGRGVAVGEGEAVGTGGGSRAVLRLSDGSLVEMGERAELTVTARGHDMTITLGGGPTIFQAAERRTGHLRVASGDCTVSVTGTVFSVNNGLKGSRVSVFEGSVRVAGLGDEQVLAPGQQWAT